MLTSYLIITFSVSPPLLTLLVGICSYNRLLRHFSLKNIIHFELIGTSKRQSALY